MTPLFTTKLPQSVIGRPENGWIQILIEKVPLSISLERLAMTLNFFELCPLVHKRLYRYNFLDHIDFSSISLIPLCAVTLTTSGLYVAGGGSWRFLGGG